MERFYFITFIFILLGKSLILAQCPIVDAGLDQLICSVPAPFALQGITTGDVVCQYWEPAIHLDDPDQAFTNGLINETTTFYFHAKSVDFNNNLVTNGDFSGGNSGFLTDYSYNANPSIPANQLVEGQYVIGSNPQPMHMNWQACGDHTSGTGDYLIANGHETANQNVWCQTINVDPNTDYAFSAWVVSVDPNGPVEIQFSINGLSIGPGNVGLSTTCDWINFFEFWNSGSNTTATICIQDLNTQEPGNDFGIDDIVFAPFCEEMDSVTIVVSEVIGDVYNDSPICAGSAFFFNAIGGISYNWEGPDNFVSTMQDNYFNSSTVDQSGIYYVTISDQLGCTAELETEVLINRVDSIEIVETTCDTSLKDYVKQLKNEFNCDSIVSVSIDYLPISNDTVLLTSCDSTIAGILVEDFTNEYGCDSTITIITSFVPSDSVTVLSQTCDPNEAGTTILNLSNAFGCDSIVSLNVQYDTPDTTKFTQLSCDPNLAGIDIQILTNELGCDSIIETEILHTPNDTTMLMGLTCDPSEVGVLTTLLFDQEGCDSIVSTLLILDPIDTSYITYGSCDPFETGITFDTLASAMGCDSVIVTEVTLNQSDTIQLMDQTCDPNQVGIYSDVFVNQFGCDSMIQTTYILNLKDTTFMTNTSCDPAQIGIELESYLDEEGCDSIVSILTILERRDTTFIQELTCDPDMTESVTEQFFDVEGCDSIVIIDFVLNVRDTTYLFDFSCEASMAGIFTEVFTGNDQCDSIVVTDIQHLLSDTIFLSDMTCDPSLSGIFTDQLINENGCDSIVITSVDLLPQDTTLIQTTTCNTDSIGTYELLEIGTDGCDSLVITEYNFINSSDTLINLNTCNSTEAGIFMEVMSNQFGCDSTITTVITWIQSDTSYLYFETCDSSLTDIILETFENVMGCDSVVITETSYFTDLEMNLEISQPNCFSISSGFINLVVSGGTPPYLYSYNGNPLQEEASFTDLPGGLYELTVQDANGCEISEIAVINTITSVNVELGDDQIIEFGEGAEIQAIVDVPKDSLTSIEWTSLVESDCPECLEQVVYPIITTSYSVTVINKDGCIDTDNLLVSLTYENSIYIPNIFINNGSLLNDQFRLFASEGIVNNVVKFEVYSRWGELVFGSKNCLPDSPDCAWNGIFNGEYVTSGVYVWLAQVSFIDGSEKTFAGDVTFIK